jgi:hypothetical protein
MHWRCLLLVMVVPFALPPAVQAGIFFKKPPKPDAAQRVPELIVQLKTDKDEKKRLAAAEELRGFDPKAHPDIVPMLIDALLTDKDPDVRAEAAQSLGKLRPVVAEAGWALEHALEKDTSKRVRWQARTALWSYYLAGYKGSSAKEAAQVQTSEPPLADPLPPTVKPKASIKNPGPPPLVAPR